MLSFSTWSFIISALLALEAATLVSRGGREAYSEIYATPGLIKGPGVVLSILAALMFWSIVRQSHPREIYVFLFACFLLLESGLMIFHSDYTLRLLMRLYGVNFERARFMAALDITLAAAFLYLALFVYR